MEYLAVRLRASPDLRLYRHGNRVWARLQGSSGESQSECDQYPDEDKYPNQHEYTYKDEYARNAHTDEYTHQYRDKHQYANQDQYTRNTYTDEYAH